MPDSLAGIDLDTLKSVAKIVAWILAIFAGTTLTEGTQRDNLTEAELQAKLLNKQSALEAFKEENLVFRARCDAALEGFARDPSNPEDLQYMIRACHTAGGIE